MQMTPTRNTTKRLPPVGKVPAGARSAWRRNARVRRGMIQLAWRFLLFQKESALALWYRARTADSRLGTRKTMIVALARKLLIALWRLVTTGETLEGVILRPAG
jgi:transposase